jgi:hypothetical protein
VTGIDRIDGQTINRLGAPNRRPYRLARNFLTSYVLSEVRNLAC